MGISEEEFDEMNRGVMESLGDMDGSGEISPDMLSSGIMPMMQNAFGNFADENPISMMNRRKQPKQRWTKKKKKKYYRAVRRKSYGKGCKQSDRPRYRQGNEIERVVQILNRRTKNNPCFAR